jgi:hypothetical protein
VRIAGTLMFYFVTLNVIVQLAHGASLSYGERAAVGAAELIIPIIAAVIAWRKLKP